VIPVEIAPHPSLYVAFVEHSYPDGIGASPAALVELLRPDAEAPLRSSDEIRATIRDVLRVGGYKPTGRGKPASEYLRRGVSPINHAVDVCNVVSLHSGLPISVVDPDRARAPLSIRIAPDGSRYEFNAGGQEIDVGGLVCLFDADGPIACAVKDSQRTKTQAGTRRTLSVIWGAIALREHVDQAVAWYHRLLA
jgi:DNA/RNA-binding domain of Phe-tRNA-synthetase-like protein